MLSSDEIMSGNGVHSGKPYEWDLRVCRISLQSIPEIRDIDRDANGKNNELNEKS